MEEMWLARDKNGKIFIYMEKPVKLSLQWSCKCSFMELDDGLFQEVQWSDEEPTKVKLVINNG